MKIIYGTTNKGKVENLKKIIMEDKIENIEIETLKDIDFNEEIIEDGKTFEENSEIKAKAIEKYCKKNNIKYELILTDDAGLCIEKLNGEPGVYSARYEGPNATQKQILDKILDKMRQYENPEDRKCKFVCVLTGILKSGEKIVARGESKGIVAKEYKNLVGFGFRPIFIPEGFNEVMGNLKNETEKEMHSHRELALRIIFQKLKDKKLI